MPLSPRTRSRLASRGLALLLAGVPFTAAGLPRQDQLLITAPPTPQATQCPQVGVFKRQNSCQYGQCGTRCLAQGGFCCGPAGPLATSPFWVCDNGACITSVRGTTGIVDCYDPDNPSGTTQSCLDESATSSCNPTDRCYTCSSDQPFCRWETYIASNSPTLRWFSCIETKAVDLTFFASTITGSLSSLQPSPQDSGTASSSSSSTSSPGSNSNGKHGSPLSTGAIIGIAVGGGIAVVGSVAVLAFFCLKRRSPPQPPTSPPTGAIDPSRRRMAQIDPAELDGQEYEIDSQRYNRSELDTPAAYSPHSQASVPFHPPEMYGRNFQEYDRTRPEFATKIGDQHNEEWYYSNAQPPQELPQNHRE